MTDSFSEPRLIWAREAETLHRQFFRAAPAPAFINAYQQAHAELPALHDAADDATDNERHTVSLIIEHNLDALGIEPWLRSGTRRHLLARKLLLVAYLAECDGAHPAYRQTDRGLLRAWSALSWCGVRAAWHLLKGRWQKAKYGLV